MDSNSNDQFLNSLSRIKKIASKDLSLIFIAVVDTVIIDAGNDPQRITQLFKLLFHIRDIRHGLGLRMPFYYFLNCLFLKYSEITIKSLRLIPCYGCWKDLWHIFQRIDDSSIRTAIYDMVTFQLLRDEQYFIMGPYTETPRMSQLPKHMPREGSQFHAVAKYIADRMFSAIPDQNNRFASYRKRITRLCKDVLEVKMAANRWSEINPKKISLYSRKKYGFALSNRVNPKQKYLQGHHLNTMVFTKDKRSDTKDRLRCASRLSAKQEVIDYSTYIPELYRKAQQMIRKNIDITDEIRDKWMQFIFCGRSSATFKHSISVMNMHKSQNNCVSKGISLFTAFSSSACRGVILTHDDIPSRITINPYDSLKAAIDCIDRPGYGRSTSIQLESLYEEVFRYVQEHAANITVPLKYILVFSECDFATTFPNEFDTEEWRNTIDSFRNRFQNTLNMVLPVIVHFDLSKRSQKIHGTTVALNVVAYNGWSNRLFNTLSNDDPIILTDEEAIRVPLAAYSEISNLMPVA